LYLLYIAYQLFSSGKSDAQDIVASTNHTLFSAFREGFITNVMNPKATLFFLSVFTQVISPETSLITQGMYGAMMAGIV
jgi:threonine/homoserine/homoserine lactone efflux protein